MIPFASYLSLQDTPTFKGDNENDPGSGGANLNAESNAGSKVGALDLTLFDSLVRA